MAKLNSLLVSLNPLLTVLALTFLTTQTVIAAQRPNTPWMKKSKRPPKVNYPASFPDGFVIGFPQVLSGGKVPQEGAAGGNSPPVVGGSSPLMWSPNGRCGKEFGYKCPEGKCCSSNGWWYVSRTIEWRITF